MPSQRLGQVDEAVETVRRIEDERTRADSLAVHPPSRQRAGSSGASLAQSGIEAARCLVLASRPAV